MKPLTAVFVPLALILVVGQAYPCSADESALETKKSPATKSSLSSGNATLPKDDRLLRQTVSVWSLSVVTHLLGFVVTLVPVGANEFSDESIFIGYGIYSAIMPMAGVGLSRLATRKAGSLPAMIVGGYTGSLLSFCSILPIVLKDNPKADGQYDEGYFGRGNEEFVTGFLILGVLPIILPAVATTIAFVVSEKRKAKTATLKIAMPTVVRLTPVGRRKRFRGVAINFLRASF